MADGVPGYRSAQESFEGSHVERPRPSSAVGARGAPPVFEESDPSASGTTLQAPWHWSDGNQREGSDALVRLADLGATSPDAQAVVELARHGMALPEDGADEALRFLRGDALRRRVDLPCEVATARERHRAG